MTAIAFLHRFLRIWAVGVVGVAALLLQAPPAALLAAAPQLASLPDWQVRLLLALNPFVLMTVMAAAGTALAHRVGLRSRLAGDGDAVIDLRLAALAGTLVALALLGLDALLAPHLGARWEAFLRQANAQADAASWLISVLYGGLAEEVLARWGVMSLVIAAVTWRSVAVPGGVPPAGAVWLGIAVSAALFAAGHLPALAQGIGLDPGVVARTLALNMLAGVVYGWLFWRRGLECAMLAHIVTHLVLGTSRLLG
ncbi:type II CAAX prenyl endopeptidase Rce1 family protein [Ramlibacter sp.]|uniref:CPBP family glutamic-type intramembrane protease n=1 Tax=Ramlibacter sp. TaxID=1917967 RepID=UPI0035B28E6B